MCFSYVSHFSHFSHFIKKSEKANKVQFPYISISFYLGFWCVSHFSHFSHQNQRLKKVAKVVPKSGSVLGLSWILTATTPKIFQCWEASVLCFMFLTFLTFWNPYKSIENMRIFEYVFLLRGCWVVCVSNLIFLCGWLIFVQILRCLTVIQK